MPISKIFADYESWYRRKYLPTLCDEDDEVDEDWTRPLRGLKAITQKQLVPIERKYGKLPPSYRELVFDVGVGTFLLASDEEPVGFSILAPKHIGKVHKDVLGAIDKTVLAKSRQAIDVQKLMPVLVDRDWNQWVLLGNQAQDDDRVFLFSHEQEQRAGVNLFKPKGTLETYFRKLFAYTRKGYSPWYMWTGWE